MAIRCVSMPRRGGGLGIAQVGEDSVGVFQILGEAVNARASPRAAVVEGDGVPSGAPDGLGEVEVLFVPRQAVEDHQRGMKAGARGLVGHTVDEQSVAGDVEHGHSCRMRGVNRRVGKDGGRNCLGESGRRRGTKSYQDEES